MRALLKMLADTEDIHLEPSALAGMFGPIMLSKKLGKLPFGYHLVWDTGGSMVPEEEYKNITSKAPMLTMPSDRKM